MAVSLDCERVRTVLGMETAWICIVDESCRVLFKEFVQPEGRVTDYLTWVTGLEPGDLCNAPSLRELQPLIRRLVKGRLVVGHSVQTDLDYLGVNHPTWQVCDIADFAGFRGVRGKRRKLKDLAWHHLGVHIQQGPHDPEEDAWAAMLLYKEFVKESGAEEEQAVQSPCRQCASCGHVKQGHLFSNNQWRKGTGSSRCTSCVANHIFVGDAPLQSAPAPRLHAPRTFSHKKVCAACGSCKERQHYSDTQWHKPSNQGTCSACFIHNRYESEFEEYQKDCASCHISRPRFQYSSTQWRKCSGQRICSYCLFDDRNEQDHVVVISSPIIHYSGLAIIEDREVMLC